MADYIGREDGVAEYLVKRTGMGHVMALAYVASARQQSTPDHSFKVIYKKWDIHISLGTGNLLRVTVN